MTLTREKIKSLRKLKNLSQAALGQLTDLSASEISRIECGYKTPTEQELSALSVALEEKSAIAPAAKAVVQEKAIVGAGMQSANTGTKIEALPSAAAPAKSAPAVAKAAPVGSDLSDPANFGLMPDPAILQPGSLDDTAFRSRLSAEIARANTILHTPRVPAAVWRAWRQFEQQATARLRDVAVAVHAPPPVPVLAPAPLPVAKPTAAELDEEETPEVEEAKGFNSFFVESARSILPAEVSERLNRAAEKARTTDASMGFMKHFRRIAENELDSVMLKKVSEEASKRASSPERSRSRRGRRR